MTCIFGYFGHSRAKSRYFVKFSVIYVFAVLSRFLWYGAYFIRQHGFDTSNADRDLRKDWSGRYKTKGIDMIEQTEKMNQRYPSKSFLSAEEREALFQEGGMNAVCLAESMEAGDVGDEDLAWRWLAAAQMPTTALKMIKRALGVEFMRKYNIDTTNADRELGEGWLERSV